jgi:hypothetical protein
MATVSMPNMPSRITSSTIVANEGYYIENFVGFVQLACITAHTSPAHLASLSAASAYDDVVKPFGLKRFVKIGAF